MTTIKKGLFVLLMLSLVTAPVFGKTLKLALDADTVTLDPHEQLSGGVLQYSHWVFDPLVRWNKEMKIVPRLALRWKQINPTTLRFYLRHGVKFHSGNEMTAEDVVWTVNRLKTSGDFKGLFEPFKGAFAVDKYVVDVITKKPYGLVLNMMTYVFPMDRVFYTGLDENGAAKHLIDKIKPTFAKTHESGTGRFKVIYRDQGVKLVLERFSDHWDKDGPGNVDRIVLTPIKSEATRVAALLSGDVDFISPVPPQDHPRIRKNSKIKLVTMNSGRIITFQMNQSRVEAFKNPKVRLAIVYAINNVGIVKKIMRGFAVPAGQQSPVGYQGHDPNLKPRYDLAKAKRLMKEAGYANGFTVSMLAPNNRYVNDEKIAQTVASMLAKIKIKVNLKTLPKAQYWGEFDNRAADILMIGWHSDTEDSANFTEYLTMTPDTTKGYGAYNSGNYSNKEVDKLVIASQSETNLVKRAVALKRVEKILYDEAAFIPLHWQMLSYAAKKNVLIEPILNQQNFPYLGDLVIK